MVPARTSGARGAAPSLAAIVPWEGAADQYRDILYHGGIFGPGFIVGWGNGLILGYLMYRSGLVPRGMALLGLVGGRLPATLVTGLIALVVVGQVLVVLGIVRRRLEAEVLLDALDLGPVFLAFERPHPAAQALVDDALAVRTQSINLVLEWLRIDRRNPDHTAQVLEVYRQCEDFLALGPQPRAGRPLSAA